MKNILKTLSMVLLILAISFSACDESNIDIDPVGDTEAGFFQNEDQMTMAVMGIYQKLQWFYGFRGNNFLTGIWLLPSDDLTTPGDHAYENFVGLNGNDGKLRQMYQFSFQLISRANIVLQKIEENGDFAYKLEPELKKHHKGEALFLRAWMNFRLWNIFGSAVPLVTERIGSLKDAYPSSSTGTQLLDQAIIDLQEASTLLPDSWPSSYTGRVTKNAALGLLGKALVFRGTVSGGGSDFSDAISAFNQMSGVDLADNYGDNFDAARENNIESLFEFQASSNTDTNNPFLDNDNFDVVGDLAAYFGYFNKVPGWIGNDYYPATESFKTALEEGDPRKEYLLHPDPEKQANVVKYLRDGQRVPKWPGSFEIQQNNPRILRYADVLLLKAEALVRSGGSKSEAIALVNQIRQRARMSTLDGTEAAVPADLNTSETNDAVILEWIFAERRIELAFEEGHRWFDLKRRHIAGEIDLKNHDFASLKTDFAFSDYNVFFPIPSSEIIQNPNLVQNQGY